MKSLTLIYCNDGDAAKVLAADLRHEGKQTVNLRSAAMFAGEVEDCDRVIVQPCVDDFDRARLRAAYGDKITAPGAPPPPPPPFDPLANLAPDWRKRDDLRQLAAAVSGRSVENKAQAIAVIEAELKVRDSK